MQTSTSCLVLPGNSASSRRTSEIFMSGCIPVLVGAGQVSKDSCRADMLSVHLQVLETMQTSTFCLVLPGDSASSRRTSEIFMSGCIPVFVGPPYATMPFGDAVDYKATSYFFNVTDHK